MGVEKRVVEGRVYVRVTSNKVVHPGSPPDIDTDFHTAHRDAAFEHVAQLRASTGCLPLRRTT